MRLFLYLLLGFSNSAHALTNLCQQSTFDERAEIASIHDGDTLRLKDGRKVRLVGINTPELARAGRAQQAYAQQARQALVNIFKTQSSVRLVYDQERRDKYGRTLAHLFLEDGNNVQAMLLHQGLATAFTVPPNDQMSHCYANVEQQARCNNSGLWSHTDYAVKQANTLSKRDTGFRLIQGRVNSVRQSKNGIWLTVDNKLHVHIRKPDLRYFNKRDVFSTRHQLVTLRGWLQPRSRGRAGFYMALRHASALNLSAIDAATNDCQ